MLFRSLTASNAVVAVWQSAVSMPQMRRQFERRDPEFMRQVAAMGIAPGSAEEARFRDRLYSKEPYGTFGHPNSLAGLLALPNLLTACAPQDQAPVRGAQQRGEWLTSVSCQAARERIDDRFAAERCDLVDRPASICTADWGRAVQIPV